MIAYKVSPHGIKTLLHIARAADIGDIDPTKHDAILTKIQEPGYVALLNAGKNSRGNVVLKSEESVDILAKKVADLFEGEVVAAD